MSWPRPEATIGERRECVGCGAGNAVCFSGTPCYFGQDPAVNVIAWAEERLAARA